MFRVDIDPEGGQHALVASDAEKIPLRDDVWERLRDADTIFADWKALLQKWSIHAGKAPLLKRECPTEQDYRVLRTAIRMFQDPA